MNTQMSAVKSNKNSVKPSGTRWNPVKPSKIHQQPSKHVCCRGNEWREQQIRVEDRVRARLAAACRRRTPRHKSPAWNASEIRRLPSQAVRRVSTRMRTPPLSTFFFDVFCSLSLSLSLSTASRNPVQLYCNGSSRSRQTKRTIKWPN